mgnify:FL=1|jgi:hypothetical protein
MPEHNQQLPSGHAGFAFEGRMPVPIQDADRGERREVDAILAEAGFAGYIDEEIDKGKRDAALHMIRAALLDVIHPPKGTASGLAAVIVGYAIGLPGMVSMKDAARVYGLGTRGKAAISKRVKAYAEKYGLPPSNYMKSAEACATYRSTNQTKRKQ